MLDVEVADEARLQLVEQLRSVPVTEAALVEDDVGGERRQVGGDGPDVQIVNVDDVFGGQQVREDVVEVEVARRGFEQDVPESRSRP